mgnify:CR=1 FL=1
MSLSEFWINVRRAFHDPGPGVPEARRLDDPAIEAVLRRSSDWLTVDTVDGFDEADFPFLPEAGRRRLKESVEAFLGFAATRKFRRPPTPETVEAAVPVFREIVRLLEFDRYDSPEALRIGKRIEEAIRDDRPTELVDLRFSAGPDHMGAPAVWIWAYLSAEVSEDDRKFLEFARDIEDWLDPIARRIARDRWPYFYFRSIVEEDGPVEVP